MRDVVVYLARALVDDPDRVTVEELPGARAVTYEVRTAPDDVGKLIGRGGRTVKALRRVVKAAAPPGRLVVGRVLRPHGLRGELSVELHSDAPERFSPGVELGAGDPDGPGPLAM